ncbi:cupin domain-containing protein [Salipaludibacillus sp. CUR1]|uniref:cupin domain-containing protein n=1 Tax=Salipaludibacillus sp. CUR1 TaxID=2820003 RepID=UPI001E3CD173|nr:cupin domain-containing protein [Salipaludibacillus sp. CUR1]MCE7793187.1 cupin domain-containing protein [Salipaludibacillus sp. CUR1]
MVRKTEEQLVIENPHGGTGSIRINKLLTSEETMGNVSLFARVVVNPETTIGYHQHTGEAEAYYVLKGEGFFINSQKERLAIQAGDICTIKAGQSHGLENPSAHSMEIMALVYPERKEA